MQRLGEDIGRDINLRAPNRDNVAVTGRTLQAENVNLVTTSFQTSHQSSHCRRRAAPTSSRAKNGDPHPVRSPGGALTGRCPPLRVLFAACSVEWSTNRQARTITPLALQGRIRRTSFPCTQLAVRHHSIIRDRKHSELGSRRRHIVYDTDPRRRAARILLATWSGRVAASLD